MTVENKNVATMAAAIEKDLNKDPQKKDWSKSTDPWWYFSQVVKNINSIEKEMSLKNDISQLIVSTSSYLLIISNIYDKNK